MRNKIIAIALFLSFLIVVIHEMMPHHHHEKYDEIELFSHHQNSYQNSNSETGNANHFPFPAHQHVMATEGFDLVRVNTNLERAITPPFCFIVPYPLLRIPDAAAPESTLYSDFSVPLSSLPFIISPNAMRGSPSIA